MSNKSPSTVLNTVNQDAKDLSIKELYHREKNSRNSTADLKEHWHSLKVLQFRNSADFPDIMSCQHSHHKPGDSQALVNDEDDLEIEVADMAKFVVAKCPNLTSLHLNVEDRDEIPQDFGKFLAEHVPNLEHITLNDSSALGILAQYVVNLKSESKLHCIEFGSWDKVTINAEDAKTFLGSNFAHLERLVVPGSLASEALSKFSPTLKELVVGKIAKSHLRMITDLCHENLTTLSLDTTLDEEDIKGIATKLTKLQRLSVVSCLKNIKPIQWLEHLKELYWNDSCCQFCISGFRTIDAADELLKLTTAVLEPSEASTDGSLNIGELVSPPTMVSTESTPPADDAQDLALLSDPLKEVLQKIGFNLKTLFLSLEVLPPVYSELASLCPNVQSLGLFKCIIFPEEALESMALSESLVELSVCDVELSRESIKSITKLPKLSSVNICYTEPCSNSFYMSQVIDEEFTNYANQHADRDITVAMVTQGQAEKCSKRIIRRKNLQLVYVF
ncbi:hypothetical protein HDE_06797 [Halotydeus destructor]|nr:hypothetical protein HDE_06797 [Halotydeus destructor]